MVVRSARALLAGEQIEYNGKKLKLPVPPKKRMPVLVAAEGPKTFDFAGGKTGRFYSLPQLEKEGVGPVSRLPVSR